MTREQTLQALEDKQYRLLAKFREENPGADDLDYGDIPAALEYYRGMNSEQLMWEMADLDEALHLP